MIFAAMFAVAIVAGWGASLYWGGRSERETMCLLTCVWLGTLAANIATGDPAPVIFYAALDVAGIIWLAAHQRRNWQWIPAGIFAVMMLVHFIYWSGTGSGLLLHQARPYQDILAVLAYLQIFFVGAMGYERTRKRDGAYTLMGDWAFATDWVLRFRLSDKSHARAPR